MWGMWGRVGGMCVWALISCDVSGNVVNSSVWGDREPASQSPVSPLPPQRPQAFHLENRRSRPNCLYHNVDLVVLITSVRSMPRNSDFQEITFYTGHRKQKGHTERIRIIISRSAKPWRCPGHPPTRTLAQESYTPFGRWRFPPLTLI